MQTNLPNKCCERVSHVSIKLREHDFKGSQQMLDDAKISKTTFITPIEKSSFGGKIRRFDLWRPGTRIQRLNELQKPVVVFPNASRCTDEEAKK
jgi:hypothetical protein